MQLNRKLILSFVSSLTEYEYMTAPDETTASSEEDFGSREVDMLEYDQIREDRELKDKLHRKYSGYISLLKNEFSNKKKKAKLPREARQVLLDWWAVHYKWPYPTVRTDHFAISFDFASLISETRLCMYSGVTVWCCLNFYGSKF